MAEPPDISEHRLPAASTNAVKWIGILEAVSLAYMMAPVVLYLWGWLHLYFALPLIALFLAGGWSAWRDARADFCVSDEQPDARRSTILAIGALTLFLVACTGLGHFTFQFFDYVFYNAVLRDLMQYTWPLAYAEAGPERTPQLLVIYPAFWLVASLVGKAAGWYAACYAHYLWAALGLFLITLWFLRIAGTWRLGLALMLLFFGGMDIIGRFFTEGGPVAAQVGWWDYLTGVFWWSEGRGWLDHWSSGYALTDKDFSGKAGGVFFRFYSPLSFLVDGPQHLPGMVGVMMALHDLWRRRTTERMLLLWSCLPLCSVFVAAGSVPFLLLGMVENKARRMLSLANAAALPVIPIFVLFFSSAVGGRVSGAIWKYQSLGETWWYLLLHYGVEFGVLAGLVALGWRSGRLPSPLWFLGALAMFVLAPFYRMGQYNDFASKIIIPAQFVFLLLVGITLFDGTGPFAKWRRAAMIAVLLAGTLAPLGVVMRALDFGLLHLPPKLDRVRHVNDIEPRVLALQGKGDPASPFWKYLAKPAVYRPSELIYPNLVWNYRELKEPLNYWIFFTPEENYGVSSSGLKIKTKGNNPILRRDNMALQTDTVGMIEIDAEITVDGHRAEDAAIVALWASEEQVKQAEGDWPFQRWHSNQAWPVRNIVSSNSYWRGTVNALAFYLKVPKGDEREYEVTIRKISFLER